MIAGYSIYKLLKLFYINTGLLKENRSYVVQLLNNISSFDK